MSSTSPNAATEAGIEQSRRAILSEIGEADDVVFIRGLGNIGDQLIWAGTRALLAERIYREIEFEAVCSASGEVALLTGGGALCRPYHEWMTRALAIAALRFERVILLPSSLDPAEDVVREALAATRATVFAREEESYRRIQSLCDARLAHDCAFFFDFGPYRRPGQGTLDVFRTDAETLSGRAPVPAGNDDISLTASSLAEWLETIAGHDCVRTDRAHVMIAAAMMGKRVEYWPSSYHKLDGIAAHALTELPVRQMQPRRDQPAPRRDQPAPRRDQPAPRGNGSAPEARCARVTALIATRDTPASTVRALDSLGASATPVGALVIDNNSAPEAAAELELACSMRDEVTFRRSDRNLGLAGARWLGAREVESEFVLLLDSDAELQPGALDALVEELHSHPDAAGVSATVRRSDGTTVHSGGWMRVSRAAVEFGLLGAEEPAGRLPVTGPVDWIPGTAALIRRQVLEEFPIERGMRAYGEDREWCYRVETARPGSFRRSREAQAVCPGVGAALGRDFASRSLAVRRLDAQACFYERHGKLMLDHDCELVPELGTGEDPERVRRLLMELLLAKGGDWLLMEWTGGGLEPLLTGPAQLAQSRAETRELERRLHDLTKREQSELAELRLSHAALRQIQAGGWWRLRNRLQPGLRLYRSLRTRGGR